MKEIIMRKATLILVACLALLAFLLGCGRGNETPTSNKAIKISGEVGISSAIELTECHIENLVNSMEIIAMTEEVKSGNWNKMWPILNKFGEVHIPAVVWFALPDGSYYTAEKGKTDQNLSDRSYFPKVMSGNKVIGDLVVSKSTSEKVVVTTVPVKNEGKVTGALGASIYLENLSQLVVKELQLPTDMVFYAVSDQGKIALHSDSKWLLKDAADLGSKSFSEAVKSMLSNKQGVATYELEGVSETVIFKTSPLTGWCFALGLKAK